MALEKTTVEEFPQIETIVIPIIDVSGSMEGDRIGSVNEAMREVPAQLEAINNDNLDGKLLIAPMEFSSGARWFQLKNDQPAEVSEFIWRDMQASGLTDMGAAFHLLREKLTVTEKGGWMKGRGGAAPIIILISDGGPTDDYKSELNELKRRGWFRSAIKFAVAVEGANTDVLVEFTGNKEAVIDTTKIRLDLASIIKKVILRASQTVSQATNSQTANVNANDVVTEEGPAENANMQEQVVTDVKNELTLDNVSDDDFTE